MGIRLWVRVGVFAIVFGFFSHFLSANFLQAKQRVGVIGAGISGMTTSLFLQNFYDVTLLEKDDRLGGHLNTRSIVVNGKTHDIDTGAEFFSDERLYLQTFRLLRALNVPLDPFPLTYTFFRIDQKYNLILPPVHNGSFRWSTLCHLSELRALKKLIDRSSLIVNSANTSTTVEKYVESLNIKQKVKDRFLYPFFAGMWGVSTNEIKGFSAYPILKWLAKTKNNASSINPPIWHEIRGGTVSYVRALQKQLEEKTRIRLSVDIANITYHDGIYSVFERNGTRSDFDILVMATNAEQASRLVANIPETSKIRQEIAGAKYFKTTIAVHTDERFMPAQKRDWSVFNIHSDGAHSLATVYKPWKSPETPIFRSWITHELDPKTATIGTPNNILYQVDYWHPYLTPDFYRSQRRLEEYQGKNNLFWAGVWTFGTISNNSALVSALKIAQRLAPDSPWIDLLIPLGSEQKVD